MRRFGLLGVLLAAALLLGAGTTQGAGPKRDKVPDELIVGFKASVSDADARDAVGKVGGVDEKHFEPIKARLVKVKDGDEERATKELQRDPRVRYVEPNEIVYATNLPNDPSLGQLWGMRNTGQTVQAVAGTADDDIDADLAWDVTTGSSNVTVAVIDTGVDFSHPDLGGSATASPLMWINPGENCSGCRTDNIDNDGNGYVDDWRGWDFVNGDNDPFDDNSHGTHVTGTIGALGNNGVGVVGVNWTVKIMALKFLSGGGSGTTADALSAILYAASKGVQVMSNSWGGGGYEQSMRDAIATADQAGALFVAAAGNATNDNDASQFYPASYDVPNLVAVAATDSKDALASFSNWGKNTVDLGAPGVDVYSTIPGGGYDWYSGTSMATPHVSGTAALAKAAFPGATGVGLKALLLGTTDAVASLSGKTVSGGRLNASTAVHCAAQPELVLDSPRDGFNTAVGDSLPIRVIGTSCASPAGATVTATANGSPVTLTARGDGLYSGIYTPAGVGTITVQVGVTVGGTTKSRTVTGSAVQNYLYADAGYSWIDATAGGTKSSLAVDDGAVSVSLPFSFSLYGASFSSVQVSSNGFLVFGSDPATNFVNAPLPDPGSPNRVVAPFWDDLNLFVGGAVWTRTTGSSPNRRFVVEWAGVPHYGLSSTNTVTFEAILEEGTNAFVFQYQDTKFGDSGTDDGTSASVGVENLDGTIGRQFLYDQALLGPYQGAKALRFTYGAPGPPDTTAPAKPTGLVATPGNTTVSLDWADNAEPDLAGYRVYRQNGASWTLIGSPSASNFTDTGRTNGTPYTYHVTAIDNASPPNESLPSSDQTATPLGVTTKVYKPAGYTIVSGTASGNHSALSRLYTNDGQRVDVVSAKLSANSFFASMYAYVTLAPSEVASLKRLHVDYDGNASSTLAAVTLSIYNWSTSSWVVVNGPVSGSNQDRSVAWETTASPASYASPTGEVRFKVEGALTSTKSFQLRTDLVGFTIDY